MSTKNESTAINELISLVKTQGPSVRDPGSDLFTLPSRKKPVHAEMFTISKKPPRMTTAAPSASTDTVAPLPRTRVPLGTQPNALVSTRMSTVMPSRQSTIPPLDQDLQTPVDIAIEQDDIELEVSAASQLIRVARPVAPTIDHTSQPWFDPSGVVERAVFENTSKVHAKPGMTRKELAKKLALPAVVMIGLGGALGVYLAMRTAPATPVAAMNTRTAAIAPLPEPAREATVAPPVAAPKITLVEVRIDSQPMGATVTLVDQGKTTFLGTTPISASVDPSRAYEVVFSSATAPTRVEKLDPSTSTHLAVTLQAAVVPASVPALKPKKIVKTSAVVEVSPVAAPVGEGTLMISSKPPCEIIVDGKPTGLMTPQRAMLLPAGTHKVTLVTPDKTAKKTVTVEITVDQPTKVIQDLLGE